MMIPVLALSFAILAKPANITQTTPEGIFVSVNYITQNSTQTYPGRARIELHGSYDIETHVFSFHTPFNNRAIGINFGTESSFLEFDSPRLFRSRSADDPFSSLLHICAGPNSLFVRRFPSFVITSESNDHNAEIILDSENPAEYAFEGQLFYSPLVQFYRTELNSWRVLTAIYFEEHDESYNSLFMPCIVDVKARGGAISVPGHVITQLRVIADVRGIDVRRASTFSDMIQFSNIDDETLASLPTLKYIVRGENGEPIQIASLSPNEYTERDRQDPTQVSVLLRGSSNNYCSFDSRIVKGLAIHFDSANNRIGFGDAI